MKNKKSLLAATLLGIVTFTFSCLSGLAYAQEKQIVASPKISGIITNAGVAAQTIEVQRVIVGDVEQALSDKTLTNMSGEFTLEQIMVSSGQEAEEKLQTSVSVRVHTGGHAYQIVRTKRVRFDKNEHIRIKCDLSKFEQTSRYRKVNCEPI